MAKRSEYHFFGHPDDMEPLREDGLTYGNAEVPEPDPPRGEPEQPSKKKKGCAQVLGSIVMLIALAGVPNLIRKAFDDEETPPPEPEAFQPAPPVPGGPGRTPARRPEDVPLPPPDRTHDMDPTARSLVEIARRDATLPGRAFSLDRQVELRAEDPRIPGFDAAPPFLLREGARIEVVAGVEAGSFGISTRWWDVAVSREDLLPAPGRNDLTDPARLWMRADQVDDAEIFRED